MRTETRQATLDDLNEIKNFVDFWSSGRGMKAKAPGAVNDFFVSPSQHKQYILHQKTYIVLDENKIVAWAVQQKDGSLIHMLVSGFYRGAGIGSKLLKFIDPPIVRSKSNQSTGNPGGFYQKHGYTKTRSVKPQSRIGIDKINPDRKPIIDIYEKV